MPGPSKYEAFDRSRLKIQALDTRHHDLTLDHWLKLDDPAPPFDHPDLATVAERIRASSTSKVLMMGAHVLRAGVNRYIIDLLERGCITHIAVNGAGAIHDYELARIGATTESVERYIQTGEFGLWRETGELNDWIVEAARERLGLGENIGRRIAQADAGDFPHRDLSIFAAAWRLSIPLTVHVGIGYDILHEHPNCDGAATGAASYRDFLIFARAVENLEHGVLLNFGSAVMAPEVYLKALAMARNVSSTPIKHFTTAVFDLVPIHGDFRRQLPKSDPGYYFRPHKTILVRTVKDGGESFYFCGDHRATVPALWRLLRDT
jgi:hypothetical protein